jgi:hypothetical protein
MDAMSRTLRYRATRYHPLSMEERRVIHANLRKFSVDEEIEKFRRTGRGWSGGPYAFQTGVWGDVRSHGDTVLEGSTALPDSDEEDTLKALRHICLALTELRRTVPSLKLKVYLDETEIEWDEAARAYIPPATARR